MIVNQIEPIAVTFTLPQTALPDLLLRLRAHAEQVKRSVTQDELVSLLAIAGE